MIAYVIHWSFGGKVKKERHGVCTSAVFSPLQSGTNTIGTHSNAHL